MDNKPDTEALGIPSDVNEIDTTEIPVDPTDVFEIDVREVEVFDGAEGETASETSSVARSAGEMAMSAWLSAVQQSAEATRSLVRKVAESSAGRIVSEMASGAMEAIAEEVDVQEASRIAEERLGRVISVVVPVVVQSLDPAELMEHIDVNEVLDAVDVNAVLDRLDVGSLLDRIDVNALLERVDVNSLMEGLNVDALIQRADVDALLAKVDLDALLARVDMDAVLERVDVAAIAKRADIGDLVAASTSKVAGSALDLGRRQAVALDTLLARTVNRILGRHSDAMPPGPPTLVRPPDTSS